MEGKINKEMPVTNIMLVLDMVSPPVGLSITGHTCHSFNSPTKAYRFPSKQTLAPRCGFDTSVTKVACLVACFQFLSVLLV
jgi:hypothetical protein